MGFGAIMDNLPIILAVLVLLLLQYFFWRPKPERTQQEIAHSLLSEVKLNQGVAAIFSLRDKPKKFEVTSWLRNKNRLDFLGESLQSTLVETFAMVEDFNRHIDAAKKQRSTSYMDSFSVDKLKGPLAKSKEGLEEWFLINTGKKEPPLKYPGIFDTLFGSR